MKSIPQYSEEPACKNDYLCLTAIFIPMAFMSRKVQKDQKLPLEMKRHRLLDLPIASFLIQSFTTKARRSENGLQVCTLYLFECATVIWLLLPLHSFYTHP